MARLNYTTTNLVAEVRDLVSETNTDAVDTDTTILPALNRGLEHATDIYARKYPDPFLKTTSVTLVAGTQEYDMPEDAFEDRLVKVEITIPNGNYLRVKRLAFRDVSEYETSSRDAAPAHYTVVGRKIRLLPPPTGAYNMRIWYVREPGQLVPVGGRITSINTGSNYVYADEIDEDSISSSSTDKSSYINFVDAQTGLVKGTMQIQSIADDGKITFRSSPVQSTVYNTTVESTIDSDVARDDYICISSGICVPYFGAPTRNFLVQFAVAEIVRKLGGQAATEEQILRKFEEQVEKTWSGRESTFRIDRRSSIWNNPRRYFPRSLT